MGHADRSSRSMLLKAQADRFAVDLILDCEGAASRRNPRDCDPTRWSKTPWRRRRPCAEPRGPGAHFRTLTPTAWAHLLHTHQHSRRPNKDSGRFCRSMPLPSSRLY
jgi:hypothetical protein